MKPLSRLLIAALFALVAAFARVPEARAQVNTDTLRPGSPRQGLSGGLDASFTMLGGNVNLLDFSVGGRVQALTFFPPRPGDPKEAPYTRDVAMLTGNMHYTARDGKAFLNQGLLHGRAMHMWHRRVGSTAFTQHQFNEFQRLRVRSLWGTSVSLQLVHEAAVNVSMGSGYMLEFNRIAVMPGAPDSPETLEHRWSNFLGARAALFEGRLMMQSTTYAQPRFDDFNDLRFLEEVEVMAKVTDMVALAGTFSVLVDTRPPSGVQPVDTRTVTSVRLSF